MMRKEMSWVVRVPLLRYMNRLFYIQVNCYCIRSDISASCCNLLCSFTCRNKRPGSIYNTSSKCYMISVIQAIAASDILIAQFEDIYDKYPNCSSLGYLIDLLRGVIRKGRYKKNRSENTQILNQLILEIKWNKCSQQDAFEIMTAIWKSISDNLKIYGKFFLPMKIKLIHSFKGIDVTNKIQNYLGLSLGLCGNYHERPGVILEYLIDQHFQPSLIDGNPNKTSNITIYEKAPEILLLHIQANKWDDFSGVMVKPIYYILYEENMTLWLDIAQDLMRNKVHRQKLVYNLKSVVSHSGNISQGHYVTYRTFRGKWFKVDDETVTEIQFDKKISPYILIYEKL